MKFFQTVIARLLEPSTHAALSAGTLAVSQMVRTGDTSSDLIGNALTGVAVLFGVIGASVAEKGRG
jgi:hypothetical protein